jgi:predicted nucleotidyltransferase
MSEKRTERGWNALTEEQSTIATEFLAERSAERRHLVAYLSGAHAYGFPSPDSDLDLKCVHVASTRRLVGLDVDDGAAEIMVVSRGIEIDYGSNELGAVLRGVVRGNGNFIERLLGATTLIEHADLDDLRTCVEAALSRRVARHYGGFAANQRRLLGKEGKVPTAKNVLYVLRTALTGVHLLETREVVTDLVQLSSIYPIANGDELIAIKRRGERVELSGDELTRWEAEMDRVLGMLDGAAAGSPLPSDPSPATIAALDDYLIRIRQRSWD